MKGIRLFAAALFLISTATQAKDLGFRYKNGKCVNDAGEQGLNPSFLGQCADWQGVVLSRAVLDDLDFSGSAFDGADLNSSSFRGANLTGARFVSAVLDGAELSSAIVHNVDLTGASMVNAHLSDADFNGVDFTNANLKGAKLSYLSFPNCKFTGTNFQDATMDNLDLRNIDFTGTNFSNADLSSSDLSGAVLRNAKLASVNLMNAKLVKIQAANADFKRAVLRDTDVSGAILSGGKFNVAQMDRANLNSADLTNSDLRNAILTGANLEGTQLNGAKYSKRTQLPITQKEAEKRGMMMTASTAMILWDENNDDPQLLAAKKKFEEIGMEIEMSKQGRSAFDGTEDLSKYSIIFQVYDHSADMLEDGQKALVKFVKDGGTYIGTGMTSHFVESHSELDEMKDLVLLVEGSFTSDDITISAAAGKDGDIILDGVIDSKVNANYVQAAELRKFDTNPSQVIAVRKEDGTSPIVATRQLGAGHVVQIAFMMSGNANYPDLQQAMLQKLIMNSLEWASQQ